MIELALLCVAFFLLSLIGFKLIELSDKIEKLEEKLQKE